VSKLRFRISTSLDGFIAGPNQSKENPLGVGGERLHEWVVPLKVWLAQHGKPGGDVNESNRVVEEQNSNIGATIMGRNMFGGHPGPWVLTNPWKGWWGDNPPFHHPVFVLTHHPREPLILGDTTFTFVADGIQSALDKARSAAGDRDVALAGGAKAAQQYLNAGLVDEMELSVVPTLLGTGERLFDGIGADLHGLELVRTVAAPKVTHLKFEKKAS
jgi:dihydrofolate reductase